MESLSAQIGPVARQLRTTIEDGATIARLARDFPRFVRSPLTLEQAREHVAARLARREQRLVALAERAIYGYDRSPYRRLLSEAGCELGDFRSLIAREGIEGGLSILARQGVYITFDELKGRRDAVRGSRRFRFDQADFDNPLVAPHLVLQTSGSGGRPSRVRYSLAYLQEWAADIAVLLDAHGVIQPRHAFWWPVPLGWFFLCGRIGQPSIAWFYPVHPLPVVVPLAAHFLAQVGRMTGFRLPTPRRCDLTAPDQLLEWLVRELRSGGPLVLWTTPSAATRLSAAACAAGVDLSGLTFQLGGEAVTPARRRQIEASGASLIVGYSSVEVPGLSYGCATADEVDDVHVMETRFAVIQRERTTIEDGPTVHSLMVTSLSPGAVKIALNMELGDHGRLDVRACGCRLGALGLRTHLSDIRSFEKFTGEGITFARSNLMQILEEVLPGRFGGGSLDYQLAEEETDAGATRLVLRVNPTLGPMDDDAVREVLLDQLGRGNLAEKYGVALWRSAGTLVVVRERPRATRAGKVLPFHLQARAEARGADT